MKVSDISVDDPTLRISNLHGGEADLKKLVDAKLKIVAGDSYNETLADYVMVLVRNGRSKSEVIKDLAIFIGEETASFVSWLWDQLSYSKHKRSSCDNATKTKSQMSKKLKRHSSQLQQRNCKKLKSDVEYKKQELTTINRSQHIRKSYSGRSKNDNYLKDISNRRANFVGRSHHPFEVHQKHHRRLDEVEPAKNKVHSFQSTAPTSRLLQSALRDLIFPRHRTTSRTESALNQLHKRVKHYSVEDAEDVGSVFSGRQNHDIDTTKTNNHPSIFEGELFHEEELKDIFQITEDTNYSTFDDNGNEIKYIHEVNKDKLRSQEQHTAIESDTSHKILNISVNVNTWKPPRVENTKNLVEVQGDARRAKRKVQLSNTVISEDHLSASSGITKKFKKIIPSTPGLCSATCISDDADTRIIFISNVHFATTKEILSHHFSEFGDIRKAIILSDTTTGQPTGSAIIEFSMKESAEQALSLNGTYFMSRVLKIVKGKAPLHDNAQPINRPRISRYSLSGPIYRRVIPLSRGGSSSYFHQRAPLSLRAPSLQWNREGRINSVQSASAPKKNFTYLRNTD